MAYIYLNGKFIKDEEAQIGVNDLAIRRGFGVFDFFRTVRLEPLFISEHISRFNYSASRINLSLPVKEAELVSICEELIYKNKIQNGGVRLILTGGYSPDSYLPSIPNLIITNEPLKLVSEEVRSTGVKVITHDFQREFPEVKTINYLTGIVMQQKALKKGAYDVLYHDREQVREFTRSNVFAVFGKKIVTPGEKILKGITRGKVFEIGKNDYEISEEELSVKQLIEADEVFMTGTTKKILPVIQINERIIGNGKPGAVTMEIFSQFCQLEQSNI